ncbi:MAG TPA: phosphoribosyltransferase [Geobacteraceae bacterium]|nr:phosphoribosyltransferase [Geobacteraceae bacterium]
MIYKDRRDAGRQLAGRLSHYRGKPDAIVLGLPRGGVAVAAEIATALNLPLDILIVRKIGFPGNQELAVGALSETGALALNEEIIAGYGVGRDYLARETTRQNEEIARRKVLFRSGEGLPPLAGKTVILVDDGVATGATVKAAIATLKQERLGSLVVALPVASPDAEETIRQMVDEWVCLQAPTGFMAVGSYYYDFNQVEDTEVVAMLRDARERGERP